MENATIKNDPDKPTDLTAVNKPPSSIVPNFLPDLKQPPIINNGSGNAGLVSDIKQILPQPSPSINVASVPASNTLSKLLTTPGAPSVTRSQTRPQSRPQARPQTPNYLANIASRNPVDYNLYRNNGAFPNYINGNLTQMQTLPAGFNNYAGLKTQLGANQASLSPQIRPASSRPIVGRMDTTMYSIPPNTQTLAYRPQARPQYASQSINTPTQVRPRGASTRPGYISSPAISMAGAPAATPVRASVPNEKVFSLLFSQLSTTNQILLSECLTKLKNKVLTWDEFHRRTQEIFGNKHSAFIQAIGADTPRPANPPQTTQSNSAPKPSPIPAPVPVPTSSTASFPASNLSSQAANPPGVRAPLWNFTPNQGAAGVPVSSSLSTFGQPRPQASPQTTVARPLASSNPTSGPVVRPPLQNETRSNGDDNRAVDFDNLTDVMGSAGVDLREESENIMRGVHGAGLRGNTVTEVSGSGSLDNFAPPSFVEISTLNLILSRILRSYDVTEVSPEVMEYLSLAVEERLRSLIEQMVQTSKHRVLSQQTYPAPPLNDLGKPIYKVAVHRDPRKQLQALDRVDKDRVRKYYLRLEEGSQVDEDGESRSKKAKSRRDPSSGLTATASARNMSEESRKANANQTTHMFTGGLRKSWMLASTTPRISSPLASTPPKTSRDPDSNKDSKKTDRVDSPLSAVKRHAPAVSSNLVPKDSGSASPATHATDSKSDQSSQFRAPTNPGLLNLARTKPLSSPLLGSGLSSRFGKKSGQRSLSIQDALFVLESDTSGRPCSSRAKLIMRTYASLK